MIVDSQALAQNLESGPWRQLHDTALEMIKEAEDRTGKKIEVKLGGSTRLMLDLQHRISDDVDLFITEPQWICELSPRRVNRFADRILNFEECSSSLELHLTQGEIEFIVAPRLLNLPDERSDHTPLPLEPIGEVLAKKLFYRGWAMTPRDLFDWWHISTKAPDTIPEEQIASLLAGRHNGIRSSLTAMTKNPLAAEKWQLLRAAEKPALNVAVEWARKHLLKYELMHHLIETGTKLPPLNLQAPAPNHTP